MEPSNVSSPVMDRIARKVSRLRTLIGLGGTMEDQGNSLHVADLRINVGNLPDMDELVWGQVQKSIMARIEAAGERVGS